MAVSPRSSLVGKFTALGLSQLFLTVPSDLLVGLCVYVFSLNEQGKQTAIQQVKLTSDGIAV